MLNVEEEIMTKAKKLVLVSRESLQALIDNASPKKQQVIIGRALVALLDRQTQDEQSSNTTNKSNNVGFTGADAFSGSISAKYYIKNKSLKDFVVEKWTKRAKNGFARLTKYHKQLNEIAIEKASTPKPVVHQGKGWLHIEANVEHFQHELARK